MGCSPRTPRFRRRAAALGALAFLLGLLVALPAAGDPAVAAILLEQGKKAIGLRKFDEAVQRLERAREEDPAQAEAAYLLGTVYEKLKDPAKALSAYRTFREVAGEQQKAGTLDKRLVPLLKKAEERVALLGKAEGELTALTEAFAGKIAAFAQRTKAEDADIARRALERLLLVAPGHEAATRLLAELAGGSAPAAPTPTGPSPIPGVSDWTDLLAAQALSTSEKIAYADGLLVLTNVGGSVYWTDPPLEAPEVFVYEIEFRVTKALAPSWLVGLAFARDREAELRTGGKDFGTAFAQASTVVISMASGERHVDVGSAAVKPLEVGSWHRLTLACEQEKARLFLDGKRVTQGSAPGKQDLAGPVGVFHQRCEAEVRVLRLGKRP